MKLFFHIGASKCASSSIQQYFSYNSIQSKFAYAQVKKNGLITVGSEVQKNAQQSESNYVISPISKFDLTDAFIKNFKNSLKTLSLKYDTLFFSYEGLQWSTSWINQLQFVLSEHSIEILYIIRPPVQWMNSAWWQWHQWEIGIEKVDGWASNTIISKSWLANYHKYNKIPCIENIHLLSLQRNIIEQLCNIMRIKYLPSQDSVSNESSSTELLNFLSLKKHLRPVHSPRYEFILNHHLRKRTKSNWVLSEDNVKTILENTRETNLELAKLISNENILENKAWWDISYYEKEIARFNRSLNLSYETMADMLEEAYTVICSLDTDIRKLKTDKDFPPLPQKKVENQVKKNNQIDLKQQTKPINGILKAMNKTHTQVNSSTTPTIKPSLLQTFKNIIFQPIIKKNAFTHCSLGNLEPAENIAQNVIANNPTTAWAYYILGKVQWQRGEKVQAHLTLQKAIDLEPQTQYFRIFKESCK